MSNEHNQKQIDEIMKYGKQVKTTICFEVLKLCVNSYALGNVTIARMEGHEVESEHLWGNETTEMLIGEALLRGTGITGEYDLISYCHEDGIVSNMVDLRINEPVPSEPSEEFKEVAKEKGKMYESYVTVEIRPTSNGHVSEVVDVLRVDDHILPAESMLSEGALQSFSNQLKGSTLQVRIKFKMTNWVYLSSTFGSISEVNTTNF